MDIVVNSNLERVKDFIRSNGYRSKDENVFFKKVKGGRLHLTISSFNMKDVIELHFDKFKGNRKKKFGHSTKYVHPLVKNELEMIKAYDLKKAG